MFRLTGEFLLIAALVSAGSLHGGHKVDEAARSEIVDAAEKDGRDLPLDEEKAVARSVLKKPTLPKKPALTELQMKQKAKEEADAAANKQKSAPEVRRTLKGIKYEAEEQEEATTHAPESLRLKAQDPAENVEIEQKAEGHEEHELEAEHEEDHEQEHAEETQSDNWLFAGAEVEWNPMVGKKAKHLLAERDWLVVTIVDKEHDAHGKVVYGIKKGGLRTAVAPEQLRKPVKHLKEAEHKRNEENFWKAHRPTEPPSDDLEDVMIPMHAQVGSTCKGKPERLGNHHKVKVLDGFDAEDCRIMCVEDKTCQYASHGLFKFDGDMKLTVHCAKFKECDQTTGKGYRTWVKTRLDTNAAQKARNAEQLEDEYMEKILEAENVAEQQLEEQEKREEEKEAKKETEPSATGQAITIQGQSAKVNAEQQMPSEADAPLWRIMLEVGAVVMITLMFLKRGLKNRKLDASIPVEEAELDKEMNAFIKMRAWLQRESKSLVNLLNRSRKEDPVEVEFSAKAADPSSQEQVEPKKNVARSFGAFLEEDPEDAREVSADAPVNRSALRAAFAASNKRTGV